MQIRVSRTTRNGRTYEYAQLVESVRRPSDGKPTHRVIASLGALSPLEVENLRTTLEASRKLQRVGITLPTDLAGVLSPVDNLKYLDLAVLLELWSQWGLAPLLSQLLPDGEQECSPASVVASLVLQRCSEPGSKLKATQWLPGTALPELLGIKASKFNNTRLHRVLDALDAAGNSLMERLPQLYCERAGAFRSLFLDVTDTWFVGSGPELAHNGKTKEGFVRKKVGIVLLCDQRGFPLRWEVIAGNTADSTAMTQMMQAVAGLDWVGQAPIVVDRAMGRSAQIRDMAQTRLRFLTALTVSEFECYSERIPFEPFAHLQLTGDHEEARRSDVQSAAKLAALHMTRAEDDLYVLDLGMTSIPAGEEKGASNPQLGVSSLAEAMRLSRALQDAVTEGRCSSYSQSALALGLTKGLGHKYGALRKLASDIQDAIIAGEAEGHTLADLRRIAALGSADAQRQAFTTLVDSGAPRASSPQAARSPSPAAQPAQPAGPLPQVRVLAYFNPNRFIEQRATAAEHLKKIEAAVLKLNASSISPRSKMTEVKMAAAIDRELRSLNLLQAFEVHIDPIDVAGRTCYQVRLRLNQEEWERRRRYDGFSVLVCHQDVVASASEVCRLYRAKDAVEKDFQTIKSFLDLRPVRHRTDPKVRAHVTICMLALLLKQTLAQRLGKHSPEYALELLRSCHLNRYLTGNRSHYKLTALKKEQRAILRALGMTHLAEEAKMAVQIAPR